MIVDMEVCCHFHFPPDKRLIFTTIQLYVTYNQVIEY